MHEFPDRTENEIKNKFYTTLRRVATRAQLEDPNKYDSSFIKCKSNLLQFVDAAIECSHLLPSKRGRKQRAEMKGAKHNAFVVPKSTEFNEHAVNPPPTTSQRVYRLPEEASEPPLAEQHTVYTCQMPWVQCMYLNVLIPYKPLRKFN